MSQTCMAVASGLAGLVLVASFHGHFGTAHAQINCGERSEPHTCGESGKLSIWYVRIPYIHSALFVHDAIFYIALM